MAMLREELKALIDGLAESTDGTRLDDYATIKSEMDELYDAKEKLTARVDEVETKNGALVKENLKLFSRVGGRLEDEISPPKTEEQIKKDDEDVDYMSMLIDEKGGWK